MKAGQLARILQCVDPETEVYFSVGYDIEERKDIVRASTKNVDLLTEIDNISVEIYNFLSEVRVDVNIYPDMKDIMKSEQV